MVDNNRVFFECLLEQVLAERNKEGLEGGGPGVHQHGRQQQSVLRVSPGAGVGGEEQGGSRGRRTRSTSTWSTTTECSSSVSWSRCWRRGTRRVSREEDQEYINMVDNNRVFFECLLEQVLAERNKEGLEGGGPGVHQHGRQQQSVLRVSPGAGVGGEEQGGSRGEELGRGSCPQQGGRRLCLPLLVASHVGQDVQGQ